MPQSSLFAALTRPLPLPPVFPAPTSTESSSPSKRNSRGIEGAGHPAGPESQVGSLERHGLPDVAELLMAFAFIGGTDEGKIGACAIYDPVAAAGTGEDRFVMRVYQGNAPCI